MDNDGSNRGRLPSSPMLEIMQDGDTFQSSQSFYRGDVAANLYPRDPTLRRNDFVDEYLLKGIKHDRKLVSPQSKITLIGSCFASDLAEAISITKFATYPHQAQVPTVLKISDGLLNSYTVLEWLRWSLEKFEPTEEVWDGWTLEGSDFGRRSQSKVAEKVRQSNLFVIFLGTSEVLMDNKTGRTVSEIIPKQKFDRQRHSSRIVTTEENLANLHTMRELVTEANPDAKIVFVVTPTPMLLTTSPKACIIENTSSKARLVSAISDFILDKNTGGCLASYFPASEILTACFSHPFRRDRRHLHDHIQHFFLRLVEYSFFDTHLTSAEIYQEFLECLEQDEIIGRQGLHFFNQQVFHTVLSNDEIKAKRLEVRRKARLAQQEARITSRTSGRMAHDA